MFRALAAASIAILAFGCSRADPPALVITQSSAGASGVSLGLREGGFVAAWSDTRDGNAELYLRLLDDQGAPFGPERRLTKGPEESYEPRIATLDDAVALAWYEQSANGTLVAKVGLWDFNGRNRWVRTLATDGRNPVVARHADDLFCAWIATGRDGQEAVWGAWFTATDTDFVPLLLGPASKTTLNLNATAAAGRTAVVVYDAVAGTKSSELFLADVTVAGARLHQITDDDGVPSKYPDIAGTTHQALTWFDTRDGSQEVYLKVGSRTAIRDPAVTPIRVTTTAGGSTGASLDWLTGSGDDRIGLAWSDNTEGQDEIYFQAFAPDGRSLGAAQRLTANSGASLIPPIVAAGDTFALAWNENKPAVGDAPSTSQVSFTTVR